jgi:hypothetical protein
MIDQGVMPDPAETEIEPVETADEGAYVEPDDGKPEDGVFQDTDVTAPVESVTEADDDVEGKED